MKGSCLMLVLFALLVTSLYFVRRDSADGRLIIYATLVQMIADAPWLGHGTEAIARSYMSYQAQTLSLGIGGTQGAWLASDVPFSFNEPLGFVTRYGVLGVAALIFFLKQSFHHIHSGKGLFLGVFVVLVVLSLFSYPTHYVYIDLVLVATLASLTGYEGTQPIGHTLFPVMIFGGATLYSIICLCCEIRWALMSNDTASTHKLSAHRIEKYKDLYLILSRNGAFLYDYALELNCMGRYAESIAICKKGALHLNNYDTEMLAGDNALSLGLYRQAIAHFQKAHAMAPVRFMPLYGFMQVYMAEGCVPYARRVARDILTKAVKVPSDDVEHIKREAENLMRKHPDTPPEE